MKSKYLYSIAAGLLLISTAANAELSATIKATSDYTFNGVSQTDNGPALQGSLDYGFDSGWYVGSFTSNVDFGGDDDTWLELDAYAGKFYQLNEQLNLDVGLAYYTYHGDSFSDEYNYPELYSKLGYDTSLGHSEAKLTYTWDYFGLGGGHYTMLLGHTISVAEGHDIRFSVDRSTSLDEDKWSWDGGKSFNHYRIAYMTDWSGFNFSLAAEDTSMNLDTSDERLVLSVSRQFML
ncbi:TorF family putative porin [Shewanella glacialipiscicola]|uniref:TorF family putative porin n=1 Tax=Shewanella glacialipiscicola TaxID=614069 RepID=UPI0021D921C6|nr:TorF family putative porin [Shewanella glacialipiscicola]MCU7996532.1 TorF family putative porin [Shewanella glacialipiscicola]MCU8027845.1 TorF family putative porin [Shewanella glacialipiscicola]